MNQPLTFMDPSVESRKRQRDIMVQGALAAQNAVKGKAPLDLPPAPAPPAAMAADPLAALGGGGAGGAALNGPGTAPALPPPGPAEVAMMGGAAPSPVPAFATGGAFLPGTAPDQMLTGPGMQETATAPRIDLPAPAPEPTAQVSPEPYELDPSIVTADRLLDVLIRAQQGEDQAALVQAALRPRTQLPSANPRMVEQMEMERRPVGEPPGSFMRWLAATNADDTEGVGRELVEIYNENPDAAADLWGIVQSGLTSEERDSLPSDLLRALKGGESPSAASDRVRLSLPGGRRGTARQY